MKLIAGVLGGVILALLGSVLLATIFATNPEKGMPYVGNGILIFWVAGVLIGIFSPNAAKAWRRIFILSAILSFLLPLSALIFSGSYIAETVDSSSEHAAAEAIGATIGGGLISGLYGFIGLFLGIIFLIIGLLVGRDKQIIYIEKSTQDKDNN